MAFEGGVHHVSRIERMDVIRREGSILLRFIDWLVIKTFSYWERLNNCADNVLLRLRLVRLDTWEPKWGDPLNWLSGTGNNLSTLWEPLFDVISITEQITDTFYGDLSEILCSFIEITVSFVKSLILELSLNLFTSTDECHTIHRGHHSLFDDFSGDITLQTLGNLKKCWVSFIFNLSDN